MAANLLAEFEDFYQPSSTTAAAAADIESAATSPNQPNATAVPSAVAQLPLPAEAEDDDFGDFETYDEVKVPLPTANVDSRQPVQEVHVARKKAKAKVRDENVLFDAEEDLEDSVDDDSANDDFGDFEGDDRSHTVAAAVRKDPVVVEAPQHVSLIEFDEVSGDFKAHEQSNQPSMIISNGQGHPAHDQTRFSGIKSIRLREPSTRLDYHEISEPADDSAWDAFGDPLPLSDTYPGPKEALKEATLWPSSSSSQQAPPITEDHDQRSPAVQYQMPSREVLLSPASASSPEASPNNIPPPALVLTLFPLIAQKAQDQFFGPVSKLTNHAMRSDESRHYLQSLLTISIVLARIVAGRKLRWKRDTILAQSMRIGPASTSGKSGGMKLTGLDKAETAREDREVADTFHSWRVLSGRLKSAAHQAGGLGNVPENAVSYVVRTATSGEGAVLSAKACALCGLKRNERIAKVDVDVQDSFGEWWVEHWGHHDCMRFWISHEDRLKTR